jgi:multidrug efflux pump subunit AcrA (membrane-fusion protein)
MGSWVRRVAGSFHSWIPTALILALLGGLAIWGAHNNWKLPEFLASSGEADGADKPEKVEVKDVSGGAHTDGPSSQPPSRWAKLIEFPSAAIVQRSGIEAKPAWVQPMNKYVTATGMLDYVPKLYAQLSSPVNGKIWRVEKEFGATVKKGDVLVIIDSAEVGKAKADLIQSLTTLDVREKELKSLREVQASVPPATLRQAEAALREAQVRLFNDHQQLLNLGLPVALETLKKMTDEECVRHLRLLGLPEDIRGRMDADTMTANLLPLTAPFDGQVVRHPQAAKGEMVRTSRPQTLFVVADVRQLHIELDVNVEDVWRLHLNDKVTFRPENQGGLVAEGKISHISPEVNEKTRRVLVHAEVENPELRLRPNIYGTGKILVAERPAAIVVPTSAIQEIVEAPEAGRTRRIVHAVAVQGLALPGRVTPVVAQAPVALTVAGFDADALRVYLVFIRVSETKFESRAVTLGIRDGGFTEVHGIKPGEQVVTAGAHALKSELLKERIEGSD